LPEGKGQMRGDRAAQTLGERRFPTREPRERAVSPEGVREPGAKRKGRGAETGRERGSR
jgi:hypothetical protein